jgi:hypothetical protein
MSNISAHFDVGFLKHLQEPGNINASYIHSVCSCLGMNGDMAFCKLVKINVFSEYEMKIKYELPIKPS